MTERIEFVCPHCLRPCKVPPELAGKQGRCPGCGKYLEVPRVSPSIRARRSSLDDDPPDTQRRRQRAPTRAHLLRVTLTEAGTGSVVDGAQAALQVVFGQAALADVLFGRGGE